MEKYEWLDPNNEDWIDTVPKIKKAYEENDQDTLFKCCHRMCHASMLKLTKGVKRDDIDDLILDATIRVVNQIRKRGLYDNPVTQCYFSCLAIIRDAKQQFNDRILTFTELGELNEKKARAKRFFCGEDD